MGWSTEENESSLSETYEISQLTFPFFQFCQDQIFKIHLSIFPLTINTIEENEKFIIQLR